MKKPNLYHIRIQRWVNGYKEIMVWPLVFNTYDEAWLHMTKCFTFRGLGDRKMSACVERCR
jgi:hypothetical protein